MSGFNRVGWEYTDQQGQAQTAEVRRESERWVLEAAGGRLELPAGEIGTLQAALAQLATPSTPTPAQASKPVAARRSIDPDFPKKVRNSLLAMVGLVILILAYDIVANQRL